MYLLFKKKKKNPPNWSWSLLKLACMRRVFKAVLSQKPCVTKDRFQIGVPVQWGKHCNLLAVAGWYFQSHAWMLMNGLQPFQHFDMNWGFITSVWKCLLLPHQSAGVTFISNSCSLPPYMPNNRIVHETSLIWSHFAQESGLG